jgi:hypothetical protein
MTFMRKWIVQFLLLLTTNLSIAENKEPSLFWEGEKAIIATMRPFFITVDDQVSGGCLPRPNALKDKVEISLRRNGLKVVREPKVMGIEDLDSTSISIEALGFKSGGVCAVFLRVATTKMISAIVPYSSKMDRNNTLINFEYVISEKLLTGGNMQARLEKAASEAGDDLFLDIFRARDEIFSKFPLIKSAFEK